MAWLSKLEAGELTSAGQDFGSTWLKKDFPCPLPFPLFEIGPAALVAVYIIGFGVNTIKEKGRVKQASKQQEASVISIIIHYLWCLKATLCCDMMPPVTVHVCHSLVATVAGPYRSANIEHIPFRHLHSAPTCSLAATS